MRVLVACEKSGVVRDAFRRRGHDAWSCDLLPSESDEGGYHLEGDVRWWMNDPAWKWDLLIAHPPCTYLSSSGLHWNSRIPGREEKTRAALAFVRELMSARIPRTCIENPVGRIGSAIRPADQYVQPYEFGHDASKRTGLWLFNLPRLTPTQHVPPRIVNGKPRWANQTDSGQNRLGPSERRPDMRSRTYEGIAEAMADQWGGLPAWVEMPAPAVY